MKRKINAGLPWCCACDIESLEKEATFRNYIHLKPGSILICTGCGARVIITKDDKSWERKK